MIQLRNIFGQRLTYSDDVEEWVRPIKERMDYARSLCRLIDPGTTVEGLYPWQVADFQWAWTVLEPGGGALLGNDQGTGKTVSASVALANLGNALPALVICPNSVKRVWRDELPKWVPDANMYIIQGSAAKRKAIIAEALADPQSIMIINYEGVRGHSRLAPYGSVRLKRCADCGGEKPEYGIRLLTSDQGNVVVDPETNEPIEEEYLINAASLVKPNQCHVHKRELNDTGVLRTVILDEAQALADPKSQQTRACWAVCHDPSVTRRLATTGTPIANNMADLFGIMHAVQKDEYPVRSAMIDRYAQQTWNDFGGMDITGIRADHAPEFFTILDPRYRRVTKAQAAPWLPDKYRSQRLIELPPKMRKAYNEMDEKLITRLEDGTILFSPSELTQSTRLLQLSSSYGKVETGHLINPQTGEDEEVDKYILTDNPSPKIDELLQVLTERGPERPLACYAVSKQLLNLASERLKKHHITHGMITGDVPDHERTKALDDFQAGRLAVLLFNDAGGMGLTMTAADTILRLQRSWSILKNLQVEDRVHRIGSEIHDKIHVIDVVAADTVEEWQLLKLVQKLEQLEQLRRDGVDPMSWIAATGDDLRTCVYEETI